MLLIRQSEDRTNQVSLDWIDWKNWCSVRCMKQEFWALDFDGVICDSCGESSLSAWKVRNFDCFYSPFSRQLPSSGQGSLQFQLRWKRSQKSLKKCVMFDLLWKLGRIRF